MSLIQQQMDRSLFTDPLVRRCWTAFSFNRRLLVGFMCSRAARVLHYSCADSIQSKSSKKIFKKSSKRSQEFFDTRKTMHLCTCLTLTLTIHGVTLQASHHTEHRKCKMDENRTRRFTTYRTSAMSKSWLSTLLLNS